MIRLDSSTMKLEAVLGGAVAANQPEAHVCFFDKNISGEDTKGAMQRTALNNTTDVTICSAPQQNYVRNIDSVSIYNKDTATVAVTVKTDNGTTEFIMVKKSLGAGESLQYTKHNGWFIVAIV